ncbi:glycosyltransferase [Olleya sp. Hel_I_94]|jgi:glycosyltransferase involved in cell wall biosynthesis|uniref:glycosyltransferase n=1 Tax=Olleya sp. Hel_I_94 TaxID=1250001 RepID=UPI0011A8C3F0|nr:glycosyltransferase [Olleya sp. Hel_I_94]TVZ49658.1 glycosyltransferase involved in cell wall biosynthesis [Olleya sp. Hel_I_94]
MKVLQLIDSLEAGGAERVAVNYANGLLDIVDASYLCATRAEGLLKGELNKDVGYLFLNKKTTLDSKAIKLLYQFIKDEKIQIVHAHGSSFFLATIIKLLQPKLKLVWHDHYGKSEFLKQRPKQVLKFCSRFFNHIFSVNSKLEAWAKTTLKVKSVSYLPNYAVKNNNPLTTKLKGVEGKRIVCLANLRPQKDHLNLLKAFKAVLITEPMWTLHLVGQDFKDAYSKSIFDFINLNKLETSVFIYGSCADTSAILQQSTIGVLSSKSEGLPLALLEYGLAGLPVICTNVGDCSLVVKSKITGLIVPSEDTISLSQAIILYIEDLRLRYACSINLKDVVKTNFSECSQLDSILKMYSRL